MFILSSTSIGLQFWPANHTLIYENSELNVFKKTESLDKESNTWPNSLLETNI